MVKMSQKMMTKLPYGTHGRLEVAAGDGRSSRAELHGGALGRVGRARSGGGAGRRALGERGNNIGVVEERPARGHGTHADLNRS